MPELMYEKLGIFDLLVSSPEQKEVLDPRITILSKIIKEKPAKPISSVVEIIKGEENRVDIHPCSGYEDAIRELSFKSMPDSMTHWQIEVSRELLRVSLCAQPVASCL